MKTTLDLALIRWSVVSTKWNDFSTGHSPNLGAFLAGWFTRDNDMPLPENCGNCYDSFRTGYKEADIQIEILNRK